MLDLMRKNTGSLITYLLFAIIIVVFVFTFGAISPDQACGGAGQGVPVVELADVDTVLLQGRDELLLHLGGRGLAGRPPVPLPPCLSQARPPGRSGRDGG